MRGVDVGGGADKMDAEEDDIMFDKETEKQLEAALEARKREMKAQENAHHAGKKWLRDLHAREDASQRPPGWKSFAQQSRDFVKREAAKAAINKCKAAFERTVGRPIMERMNRWTAWNDAVEARKEDVSSERYHFERMTVQRALRPVDWGKEVEQHEEDASQRGTTAQQADHAFGPVPDEEDKEDAATSSAEDDDPASLLQEAYSRVERSIPRKRPREVDVPPSAKGKTRRRDSDSDTDSDAGSLVSDEEEKEQDATVNAPPLAAAFPQDFLGALPVVNDSVVSARAPEDEQKSQRVFARLPRQLQQFIRLLASASNVSRPSKLVRADAPLLSRGDRAKSRAELAVLVSERYLGRHFMRPFQTFMSKLQDEAHWSWRNVPLAALLDPAQGVAQRIVNFIIVQQFFVNGCNPRYAGNSVQLRINGLAARRIFGDVFTVAPPPRLLKRGAGKWK